jgi:UDP-3-O-[3-hydroxymyristoyl] glucosamine N-acyltransferase
MDILPSINAGELARLLHGELVGDAEVSVATVAPIDEAGPDALTWVGDRKFLPRVAASRAGIVLLPADAEVPAGRTAIRVSDPDLALCTVLAALAPPRPEVPPGVDPTATVSRDASVEGAHIGPHAVVGPGAVIGPGTQLHPHTYVGLNTRIGRDCVLWPGVVVREHCEIGDRVIIHPNACIGADGFGYHFRNGAHVKIPQIGRVVIEDDVEIGACACIDRARSGETRIGRGCKIDNLVQIAHNVQVGEYTVIAGQTGVSGSVDIGRYVVFGGQVGIADHVKIGDRVFAAAQTGVDSDVPDGEVLRGTPHDNIHRYNRGVVGVRRLPKLVEQVRELAQRVKQLESATNDQDGS